MCYSLSIKLESMAIFDFKSTWTANSKWYLMINNERINILIFPWIKFSNDPLQFILFPPGLLAINIFIYLEYICICLFTSSRGQHHYFSLRINNSLSVSKTISFHLAILMIYDHELDIFWKTCSETIKSIEFSFK